MEWLYHLNSSKEGETKTGRKRCKNIFDPRFLRILENMNLPGPHPVTYTSVADVCMKNGSTLRDGFIVCALCILCMRLTQHVEPGRAKEEAERGEIGLSQHNTAQYCHLVAGAARYSRTRRGFCTSVRARTNSHLISSPAGALLMTPTLSNYR